MVVEVKKLALLKALKYAGESGGTLCSITCLDDGRNFLDMVQQEEGGAEKPGNLS
jgi:hypothetical protein